MLYAISLIVLGLLAIPSLILSKKPEAKEIIAKVQPFQGWIGIAAGLLGTYGFLRALWHIQAIKYVPFYWLTWVASCVLLIILGFLLGYALISTHLLSKNEDAKEKAGDVLAKITPYQEKLGLVAIALGLFMVILSIVN